MWTVVGGTEFSKTVSTQVLWWSFDFSLQSSYYTAFGVFLGEKVLKTALLQAYLCFLHAIFYRLFFAPFFKRSTDFTHFGVGLACHLLSDTCSLRSKTVSTGY